MNYLWIRAISGLVLIVFALGANTFAQTTEFTLQGSLKDGSSAANGNYDFEFRLFDAVSAGSQVGGIVTRNNVAVAAGTFAVKLDFGSSFPGADRFLEIRVRNAGGGGYTVLDPRQQVGSSPYSLKSLLAENATNAANAVNATAATTAATATNALQLGGVAASQFVQTADPRLSDARPPTSGSTNYVQNATTLQAATNFNISGNGTVGGTVNGSIVNAATQYDLGGNRVLSIPGTQNTFAGIATGALLSSGSSDSFFGFRAGANVSTAVNNSFFGSRAGELNATGNSNAAFGSSAGRQSTGARNSFFGSGSGGNLLSGDDNTLLGAGIGPNFSSGSKNIFIGSNAGNFFTSGSSNTFIGANTVASGVNLDHVTVIGADAFPLGNFTSNMVVLGRFQDTVYVSGNLTVAGSQTTEGAIDSSLGYNIGGGRVLGISGSRNLFLGPDAGSTNSGTDNSFVGYTAGSINTTGSNNTIVGSRANVGSNGLNYATAIGSDSVVVASNTIALGRSNGNDRVRVYGPLGLNTLDAATSTHLCFNATTNNVASCTSSIRYKKNVEPLTGGMDLIRQFRPVTYDWKESGQPDLGLIAEEVAEIEPLLITRNSAGEVLGVKYDQLTVILINAAKEQQVQIEKQQQQNRDQSAQIGELITQIKMQQTVIDEMRKLVCSQSQQAQVCKENQK